MSYEPLDDKFFELDDPHQALDRAIAETARENIKKHAEENSEAVSQTGSGLESITKGLLKDGLTKPNPLERLQQSLDDKKGDV